MPCVHTRRILGFSAFLQRSSVSITSIALTSLCESSYREGMSKYTRAGYYSVQFALHSVRGFLASM